MTRKCKDDTNQKNSDHDKSSEDESVFDDADDNNWIDVAKKNNRKTTAKGKNKKSGNVNVTHIALDKNLNMAKHFKTRYECCIKELFTVDKKSGSTNKARQNYVKLQY